MSTTDHVKDKVIVVTGAGSAAGFGALLAQRAGARGARLVCADIDEAGVRRTADAVTAQGGECIAVKADVTSIDDMRALAAAAVERFGRIDVMVNNAGVMPLAFFSDHAAALAAWHRCIDINFKGVLNGIVAVHDQMIAQGRGHVINVSSIYGNFPVAGAAVYGATKAAVNVLSESLRVESRGRIKVTTIKPTGVPGTGLSGGVVNPAASIGIVGHHMPEFVQTRTAFREGRLDPSLLDPEQPGYVFLDAAYIVDAMMHAIDQPWGVSIGEVTVRATGDHFLI
ncbi:MAG: SDR family NAD(P)-dependent oxidoreductase [Acidobacteria bacterium]|nr:SDR family NAD(P)-dependent oxidoreductase [Acidobacteriota bacterium]